MGGVVGVCGGLWGGAGVGAGLKPTVPETRNALEDTATTRSTR